MRYIFIVFVLFFFVTSCNHNNGKIDCIVSNFNKHKAELSSVRDYFLLGKGDIYSLYYYNDSAVVSFTNLPDMSAANYCHSCPKSDSLLVSYFINTDMKFLAGDSDGCEILFKCSNECLKLYYSSSLDTTTSLYKEKVNNFVNKTDWIYPLGRKWFIQTNCD
jgi:hypothetical protein